MTGELSVLVWTAATIGFLHTLLGPDHYLPFVAMSKAKGWSALRTSVITIVCGLGHVMSSIVLGVIGIAVGVMVFKLESLEAARGDLAGWFLIAFGFLYLVWGTHRALRGRSHEHVHVHADGEQHSHHHTHEHGHVHVHEGSASDRLTPWVLFTIFVLGPCEPLIPLIMYPAAEASVLSVVLVASVFAVVTITTMLGCVMVAYAGLARVSLPRLQPYSHALAGLTILLCGGAIKFLGL